MSTCGVLFACAEVRRGRALFDLLDAGVEGPLVTHAMAQFDGIEGEVSGTSIDIGPAVLHARWSSLLAYHLDALRSLAYSTLYS